MSLCLMFLLDFVMQCVNDRCFVFYEGRLEGHEDVESWCAKQMRNITDGFERRQR